MKTVRCWANADAEVWRIDLEQSLPARAMQQLSQDEVARAARFVHQRDGRRYLGARHALRCVLADVTGRSAEGIAFGCGPHGKPFMVGNAGWRFSLSRRFDVVLIGISATSEIGVDVEPVADVQDLAAMTEKVFSANEKIQWARYTAHNRQAAFATCWTRKEACLKALGVGLTVDPATIDVGLDSAARRLRIPVPTGDMLVRVESFAVNTGWVGSIAAPMNA